MIGHFCLVFCGGILPVLINIINCGLTKNNQQSYSHCKLFIIHRNTNNIDIYSKQFIFFIFCKIKHEIWICMTQITFFYTEDASLWCKHEIYKYQTHDYHWQNKKKKIFNFLITFHTKQACSKGLLYTNHNEYKYYLILITL